MSSCRYQWSRWWWWRCWSRGGMVEEERANENERERILWWNQSINHSTVLPRLKSPTHAPPFRCCCSPTNRTFVPGRFRVWHAQMIWSLLRLPNTNDAERRDEVICDYLLRPWVLRKVFTDKNREVFNENFGSFFYLVITNLITN